MVILAAAMIFAALQQAAAAPHVDTPVFRTRMDESRASQVRPGLAAGVGYLNSGSATVADATDMSATASPAEPEPEVRFTDGGATAAPRQSILPHHDLGTVVHGQSDSVETDHNDGRSARNDHPTRRPPN